LSIKHKSRAGNDSKTGPSRKERDPNWTKQEILPLVEAKRQVYMDELAVEDPKKLMNPELRKWRKIALVINNGKQDKVEQDNHACKYKWSTFL
jgi:hypothetical protein